MLLSQDEVSFEQKEKELLVSQRRARKNQFNVSRKILLLFLVYLFCFQCQGFFCRIEKRSRVSQRRTLQSWIANKNHSSKQQYFYIYFSLNVKFFLWQNFLNSKREKARHFTMKAFKRSFAFLNANYSDLIICISQRKFFANCFDKNLCHVW